MHVPMQVTIRAIHHCKVTHTPAGNPSLMQVSPATHCSLHWTWVEHPFGLEAPCLGNLHLFVSLQEKCYATPLTVAPHLSFCLSLTALGTYCA